MVMCVKTLKPHCKRGMAFSYDFEDLHMLIAYFVRFSVTTAFSHLCRTVVTPPFLPPLVCGLHKKEQKKKSFDNKKKKKKATDFDKCTDSFFSNLM